MHTTYFCATFAKMKVDGLVMQSNLYKSIWRVSVYCLTLLYSVAAFSQSRAPNFDPRSGGRGVPNQTTISDTVDRPALKYITYDLDDLHHGVEGYDTTLSHVHIVEPYYKEGNLVPNLGSENSGSYHVILPESDQALRFGHQLYDQIFDRTSQDHIVQVNRSFWNLHYGQGSLIGSSNLIATFYKPFARDITFNFKYQSLSDNGWVANQSNSFKRLNLKFSQRSKSGNRATYIHYDNPTIEEEVNNSFVGGGEVISLRRSNQTFSIGNSLIFRDTSDQSVKSIWNSDLQFFKEQFSAESPSISDSIPSLIALSIGDTLNYNHQWGGIAFNNEFRINTSRGVIGFLGDFRLSNRRLGATFEEQLFENVLGAFYQKNNTGKLGYNATIRFGLFEAAGLAQLRLEGSYALSETLMIKAQAQVETSPVPLEGRSLAVNEQTYQNEVWSSVKNNALTLLLHQKSSHTQIELKFQTLQDILLVDNRGLYNQIEDNVTSLRASLSQRIRFGPIQSKHDLVFQSLSDDRLSLPELSYHGDIYFQLYLFKKKMLTQLGADVYFIPNYDTPEFYALTGAFSNNASSPSGDVVYVNPYFNAQVGPFLFFVKGVNVTRQLGPVSRFLVADFPTYDTRVRFGVKWTLLD